MAKDASQILVVDDDQAILELVQQTLSPLYQVETTDDWVEGINLLSDRHFDLLILDLGMPVFDAPEFLQRVHTISLHSNVPILVISAYPNLRERLANLPVNTFLAKPFSLQVLSDTVANLLTPPAA